MGDGAYLEFSQDRMQAFNFTNDQFGLRKYHFIILNEYCITGYSLSLCTEVKYVWEMHTLWNGSVFDKCGLQKTLYLTFWKVL